MGDVNMPMYRWGNQLGYHASRSQEHPWSGLPDHKVDEYIIVLFTFGNLRHGRKRVARLPCSADLEDWLNVQAFCQRIPEALLPL